MSRASTAVIGLQWGDEGKGKVIDLLAPEFNAVVRFNGGANAGHSVVFGGTRYALHLVPSGVFHPGTLAVIGNGVVVDPEALIHELTGLKSQGIDLSGLILSSRAHMVMEYHKAEDALREQLLSSDASGTSQSIGTTKRGIGPAYADKAHRSTALRIGDLLRLDECAPRIESICRLRASQFGRSDSQLAPDPDQIIARCREYAAELTPYIQDTVYLLNEKLRSGESLLFEGANATLLDVDHGTFPFITSSNCSALGISAGSGVAPRHISNVIGILKAYCTRVGAGPFPTEQDNAIGQQLRDRGNEYGTTTGRPRRCGWLDLVAARYAVMLNGVSSVGLMLFDVLSGFDELQVCTSYEFRGERTDRFLPDAQDLAQVTPIYESLPGWSDDITGCARREDLPAAAHRYLEFIEQFIGVPIELISVGPDRTQTMRL